MHQSQVARGRRAFAAGAGLLLPAAAFSQSGGPAPTASMVRLEESASPSENRQRLQTALDMLPQGGQLLLPQGEFSLDGPIVVAAGRSFSLLGQGRNASILKGAGPAVAEPLFHVAGTSANPCAHVRIHGLTLRGGRHAVGLKLQHCFPKLVLSDVRVIRAAQDGIVLSECWGGSLYDVEVDGDNYTSGTGLRIENANGVCLYNPRVYNLKNSAASTGILATSAESFNVYGGNIENCPRGLHVQTGGVFGGPVHIDGLYFEPRSMSAWQADQPNDHIVIEGEGPGTASVSNCLFQAGSRQVPIAFTAVRARGLACLSVTSCVWQKAKFRPGQGENFFIDADDSVAMVVDQLNYLVSTSLGDLYRIDPRVRHQANNALDSSVRRAR